MPKVSIIIPCYNQAEFLSDTIDCLLAQDLKDWECIIVDDGSTDNSYQIACNYKEKDLRFKVYKQPNSGSATARNRGLQEATGKFIQFLDADDIIEHNKLCEQVEFMLDNHLDVSYCNYKRLTLKDGKTIYQTPAPLSLKYLRSFKNNILVRWGAGFSIPIHCWLYRRQFLDEYNIRFNQDIRQREDWDFHIQVASYTNKIGFLSALTGAIYRNNPTGKTGTQWRITTGNIIFLSKEIKKVGLTNKILLGYRLSIELWLLLGRVVKYKQPSGLRILLDPQIEHSPVFLTFAILLLPFSLIHIFFHSIYTYSNNFFQDK